MDQKNVSLVSNFTLDLIPEYCVICMDKDGFPIESFYLDDITESVNFFDDLVREYEINVFNNSRTTKVYSIRLFRFVKSNGVYKYIHYDFHKVREV